MKKGNDLAYLEALNYTILLNEKNGVFRLFIPELSLIVADQDLSNAYAKISEEKKKYFENVIEMKVQDTVSEPLALAIKKSVFKDLSIFTVKSFIVIFTCFLLFVFFGRPVVTNYISRNIANAYSKVTTKIVTRANTIDENDINKMKNILFRFKPLIKEVRTILKEETKNENIKEKSDDRQPLE